MRIVDFTDGFTNASAPSSLGVTLYSVSGTRASPNNIVAGTGITATTTNQIQFVQGSGGAVDITANPQISAGTTVGQLIQLVGRSNTNTLKLDHGTGLVMNGSCTLAEDSTIQFLWDGTNWVEVSRNDI